MLGVASGDVEITCGQGPGDDKRSGFNAVRNDAMPGSVKFGHALHADSGSSRTFDFRSHLVQQGGEVSDFGSRAQFCMMVSPSASVAAMSNLRFQSR